MVLERVPEGPERAEHALGDVAHTPRGLTRDGLPVRPLIGGALEHHLLHAAATLDVKPVSREEALVGRGCPGEPAGHESGERIGGVRRLVTERLEERQKELLGRVGAAVGEASRGPYPTEQLFLALLESFRYEPADAA